MKSQQKLLLLIILGLIGNLTNLRSQAVSEANETPIKWPLNIEIGTAQVSNKNDIYTLRNKLVESCWLLGTNVQLLSFKDLSNQNTLDFNGVSTFVLETSMGKLDSRDFVITNKPEIFTIKTDPKGSRIAESISGKAIQTTLTHKLSGAVIVWTAELRDGSNYIRQSFSLSRLKQKKMEVINRICMVRLPVNFVVDNAIGTVPGSPYHVPNTNFLAAIEQPGYWAVSDSTNTDITELAMPTQMNFGSDDQYQLNTMIGVFPAQQLRRTFLYYLERERASRSRIYLHYNCWYDIEDLSDKALCNVANAYKTELVEKRNIKLDGFVLDDGWDSYEKQLWATDSVKFPNGFSNVTNILKSMKGGANLGIWISPCGGYGGQKERLDLVKKAGAIPQNIASFDMGYPGYYKMYKDICLNFMKTYGVDYFKWDNAAPFENDGRTFGNLKSTSHFMRLCQISSELHKVNPDLFINTTVGTWPSPFWLNHVDCTWRMGGADVSWIGKGDQREKGINYRDGEVYQMVVKRAPLYPLNSMMFHGVVLGHCYQAKKTSTAGNNMKNEFRSYFALGTNLQELYLSPDLMTEKTWDDLAECVRWNKKHASTLIDSHWVKGNPVMSEPYCYASWQNNEGVMCVRNPDDTNRNITLDIASVFELPEGAVKTYTLKSAYSDQRIQKIDVKAGIPFTITLKPFEVLVFDGVAN